VRSDTATPSPTGAASPSGSSTGAVSGTALRSRSPVAASASAAPAPSGAATTGASSATQDSLQPSSATARGAPLAAYALVRLRIPAPNVILSVLLAVAMFPLISLMVPLFSVMRDLQLLNTWWALVFPYAVLSMPVCTLVLISFFQDIPRDLENAAMIDGCSRIGALWHVVIPLTAPGVFTAGILAFVNAWDEFLLALTLAPRVASRTLPVGITLYQGEFSFPWPIISAALIIAIVPICIIIAVFQERVVGGLTSGGVKG
jgi:multiple sugar transport system permease protein